LLIEEEISIERACTLICLARSMWYYTSRSKKDDQPVIDKLEELVEKKPTRGFDYYMGRIKAEKLPWNHKRVKRIYNLMGLNLRRKRKRRLPERVKEPLLQPETINQVWSMDFMSDSLTTGRKVRILNLIDDHNREALAIEADTSLPAERVIRVLEQVIFWRGKPKTIRVDNGPEFISHAFTDFCERNEINIQYIQPGKPVQNAYIERFNRTFREDVLDAYLFRSLKELRIIAREWLEDYNTNHPHQSLGGKSPWQVVNSGKLSAA
jgi:putative transposase